MQLPLLTSASANNLIHTYNIYICVCIYVDIYICVYTSYSILRYTAMVPKVLVHRNILDVYHQQ